MYIDVFVFVQGVLYISMTLLWFQTRTMLPPLPSLGLRHLGKRPVVNQRRGRQEVGAFFLSRRSYFLWHQKIWKHFFYGLLCVIFLVWNVSFFPYWSKFFKTSLWNSPFVLFEDFLLILVTWLKLKYKMDSNSGLPDFHERLLNSLYFFDVRSSRPLLSWGARNSFGIWNASNLSHFEAFLCTLWEVTIVLHKYPNPLETLTRRSISGKQSLMAKSPFVIGS